MLKIQEFILAHENWRELLVNAPYNLKIQEDDGFVLFKYNQIASDFHEEICKEARGLILDMQNNFKVVRKAFNKFFNLGEQYADKIDWKTATALSKEDGSLISIWFARDSWHISTNGMINAYNAELQPSAASPNVKNFGQLFEMAAKRVNFDLTKLNPNYTYTMELCSPVNKIVLAYSEPVLFHILTINNQTLEEVEMDIGIQKPQSYNLNSEKDYCDLVAQMDETHEGIVVKDAAGHRVKIKTLTYFQLHRMANNGRITLENVVDLIKANDTDELLSYFPEYTDYFNKVRAIIDQIERTVPVISHLATSMRKDLEELFSEKVAKKEFAKIYSTFELKHLYFAAYDGKLEERISKMTTSQFIKFFSFFFKEVDK